MEPAPTKAWSSLSYPACSYHGDGMFTTIRPGSYRARSSSWAVKIRSSSWKYTSGFLVGHAARYRP